MQDREMNRNLFRNHENRLYRNSFKDLNMLDTKKCNDIRIAHNKLYNMEQKNGGVGFLYPGV